MSQSEETDYDKQFEADLEKAIALSLETSEYEKFRNEQRRKYMDFSEADNASSKNVLEPIMLKPRPRPEPYATTSKSNLGLPPPPPSLRKNSSATATVDDLISFNSPSKEESDSASVTNGFEEWKNFNTLVQNSNPSNLYPDLNLVFSSNLSSSVSENSVKLDQLSIVDKDSFSAKLTTPTLSTPTLTQHYGFKTEVTDFLHNFRSRPPNLGFQYTPQNTGNSTCSQLSINTNLSSSSVFNSSIKSIGFNQSTLDVLKVVGKKQDNNLIDLVPDNLSKIKESASANEFSVLDAFDPLKEKEVPPPKSVEVEETKVKELDYDFDNGVDENENDDEMDEDEKSVCSGSFYDPFDPFDYMYSPSVDGSQGDPIYAAVNKSDKPPPLPPRNSDLANKKERYVRQKSRLFENIQILKKRAALHSADLQAFYHMVKDLREQFVYTDSYTNVGLVISPTIESNYTPGTSIKLVVYSSMSSQPVPFTCDLSSSVEHVIVQVVCSLKGDMVGSVTDYVLKVYGLSEYLTLSTCLGDYEYVHQCIKLEKDVALYILPISELQRPLARTAKDDANHQDLTLEDLLPNEPVQPISHDTLIILLETIEREMDKLLMAAREISANQNSSVMPSLQPRSVEQAIKAVCALMGHVETIEISEALTGFNDLCAQFIPNFHANGTRTEVTADDGDYSIVHLSTPKSRLEESLTIQCDKIREAVRSLIESYCHAFNVDFQLSIKDDVPSGEKSILEFQDTVLVHIGGLHRLDTSWNHHEYVICAQIYHGTRAVKSPCFSEKVKSSKSFYNRVAFDTWLNIGETTVAALPRESRLVLSLHGYTLLPPDHERSKANPDEPQYETVELGWAAIQFFNHEGMLTQGSFLLSIWPPIADKRYSPAPSPGTHPRSNHPVLRISLPDFGGNVIFPKLSDSAMKAPMYEFASLDKNTQQQLMDHIEQDPYAKANIPDREVLWEKRHYLHNIPQALPKVLLATQAWDHSSLSDLHAMINCWSPMEPLSALQLLLPCFPDGVLRSVAVSWIKELGSDELVDYLPQLVQALKHETYDASPLARFLLERTLTSPRVAHHLYWLLVQSLPGSNPQNTPEVMVNDDASVGACRYHRRLQIMLRALFAISGEALVQRFMSQQILVKNLYDIAENVKRTKESLRLKTLQAGLEALHHSLQESSTSLPLSPSVNAVGVQVRTCSYFPSNTLPLKINFISDEARIFPAIFKVGDYLQQDMLTIQIIRIMDKLWLKEGLDLKMVTFTCVPTGHKRGMIELVDDSETLRKIQVEHGLTGSFKDRPIAEWLAKHNPSTLEYERAVWNFTASCAGYSVATYILGICDRHNDNIMLKTSGHLFHIDFGKFLGDAQMFGNFKRDRSPFVLTSDMAYVINGGDKPSQRFHHFVDLCCQAFSIVRKNGNLILNLFALMISSGIPGVTSDAVRYVQRALLPDKSNPEAAAMFARMIDSSLKSKFTQFNFFLHNLSQLRFTGDHNDGELLSFIPKRYTCEEEGRIKRVQVYGCQKRYDSEKYYIYILKVDRENQPDSTYLFRTYREFCEFHQKLCTMFPLAKCYSLPAGIQIGRSNIKQVAEKRKVDIEKFLVSLFKMADEIAHSDIVYTFFHPLLRDQEESDINIRKVKERKADRVNESHIIRGQLKLSVQYQKDTLMVMVHHARGLPKVAAGQEPSTYVKVYLLPDNNKSTKRKTKVVRKNCHPTFMEMLEYRLPLDVIRSRTLQATIWNHDPLQENEFLGGVTLRLADLPLNSETCEWYSLGNVSR